jgi:hypothetical protein
MHQAVTAIRQVEPAIRQERKEPLSNGPRATAENPPPAPPATHPHKGWLLDVIA